MVRCSSYDGGAERKTTNESYQKIPREFFVDEADWSEPHQSRARRYWDNVGSQHLAVLVPRLKLRFKKRIQISHRNIKATHVRSFCAAASGQSVTAAP